MAISCKRQGEKIVVMGNTYPHKDQIKAFGARFNGQLKTWEVPYTEENWKGIGELCQSTGGGVIDSSPADAGSSIPLAAEISSKVSRIPNQLKKQSGEIPKSLDIKTQDFRLPPAVSAEIASDEGLTVTQLMHLIAGKVSDAFPMPVWVIGEIQNLNQRGRSIYLSIADGVEGGNQAATLTANTVLWQSDFNLITSKYGDSIIKDLFQDGMKIRALVSVSLYKNRGQISLTIKDIDPNFTKGELALKREELIKELKKDGLYDKNRTLNIAEFPFKVGLISAKGSRAESDFCHQLTSEGFSGEVLFRPTPMQGEGVPKQIVSAISELEKNNCDIIVITRGGGTAADLRWFDAKEVAHAIANSRTPIISAIGHHDDMTIAEDISYAKLKTPTAAAQFIVDHFNELTRRIEDATYSLASNLERTLDSTSRLQQHIAERLALVSERAISTENERIQKLAFDLESNYGNKIAGINNILSQLAYNISSVAKSTCDSYEQELTALGFELSSTPKMRLNEAELSLVKLQGKITENNPLPWISKGWTQLFSGNKKIKSIDDISKGDALTARLEDGLLHTIVSDIEKRD